jgi:thioredoxin reductase (NADPH)
VPGFPNGIERHELKWLGIQHAQQAGCDYHIGSVTAISREDTRFRVITEDRNYTAEALFLAVGVRNQWVEIPGLNQSVGQSIFWSVESNGKEAVGQPAAVLGYDAHAVEQALRLRRFSPTVSLFTHGNVLACDDPRLLNHLKHTGIPIYSQRIKTVVSHEHHLEAIIVEDNQRIPVSTLFIPPLHQEPNIGLVAQLGVVQDAQGYVEVDEHFETSVPNVFAIGDMVSRGHKQVLTSCYQGMEAAWAYYERVFQKQMTASNPATVI